MDALLWQFVKAVTALFALGGIYMLVQRLYRAFQHRHPALGPYRKEGCGQCGGCAEDRCNKNPGKA